MSARLLNRRGGRLYFAVLGAATALRPPRHDWVRRRVGGHNRERRRGAMPGGLDVETQDAAGSSSGTSSGSSSSGATSSASGSSSGAGASSSSSSGSSGSGADDSGADDGEDPRRAAGLRRAPGPRPAAAERPLGPGRAAGRRAPGPRRALAPAAATRLRAAASLAARAPVTTEATPPSAAPRLAAAPATTPPSAAPRPAALATTRPTIRPSAARPPRPPEPGPMTAVTTRRPRRAAARRPARGRAPRPAAPARVPRPAAARRPAAPAAPAAAAREAPTAPRITLPLCGTTPCDLRDNICCVSISLTPTGRCLSKADGGTCKGNEATVSCLHQACDCTGGQVCCGVARGSTTFIPNVTSGCQAVPSGGNCQPYPDVTTEAGTIASAQLCKQSAECENSQSCIAQTCLPPIVNAKLSMCGLQSQAPFDCSADSAH